MAADRARDRDIPGLEGTAYRLVREIGRGGMGSVHEVQHRALGKLFVMKVLHESLAHREDFALRMQREWRTLARLEHAAIVQVTDAGRTSDGRPFFVMERLEGQTLSEMLSERGPWPAAEAVRLMLVVLSGLEAAHRAGAIHRDIKPQNLFLTPRGPKILDFGIVKSRRKGALGMTRSGVAIGTPRYMAPEQAAGLAVDGRADVYACGLVLFEMIAGRDPYSHLKEQADLVGAQIHETPARLDDLCPDAPAVLADLLARFLAKDPADRPGSARLAQAELEALLPLLDAPSSPHSAAAPSPAITREPRHGDSTAGATTGSTSLPPSGASSEVSAALGMLDTETLDSPRAADFPYGSGVGAEYDRSLSLLGASALIEDREAPRSGSPSVTPPPIARARLRSPSARPFGVAALVLFSGAALSLGVLVLHPGSFAADPSPLDPLRGAAQHHFQENPARAPVEPLPAAEAPGPKVSPARAPQPGAAAPRPAAAKGPSQEHPPHPVPEPARRAQTAEQATEPASSAPESPSGAGALPARPAAPGVELPGSGLW